MATTTNYGWTTPDDTALVKDGASAIRTLGSSVDTTTKALNPSTTLGDIEYRSSTANTNTRLGIGTSGQILAVSGGVPAWTTPAAASSYTSIASGSIGSVTTFTLSSIPSTHKFLRLVLDGVKGTTRLAMRVNSDTGTNYFYKEMSLDAGRDSGSSGENLIRLHTQYNIYSTNESTWVLDFGNYATTASVKQITINALFNSQLANLPAPIFGSGGWNNAATAISSITIFTDGDTITAGTYTLYGVN
jgi:hypothetical protein